jgi:photosystem II stability/assembly factor-like uncharacterized protein
MSPRRTAPYALLVSWVIVLAACPSDSTSPQGPPAAVGWIVLPNGPVRPDLNHHMDITFINADTGWMADIDGKLWRTEDGGASWSMVNFSASVLMRSVAFVSPTHGFVGNLNNYSNPAPGVSLWETTNGGTTLTNISSRISGPAPAGVCGMWAIDDTTVVAVGRWNGPAFFLKTVDAGQTWTSLDLSPLATGIVDVYFTDPMHGIIVGGDGVGNLGTQQLASRTVILGTIDGGATWQLRFKSTQTGTWAWKISFPSDSIGYVAEQGPNLGGFVIKTTDGGATWTERSIGTSVGFSGIGFATDNVGWVGSDTATFETDDGGVTWSEVRFGTSMQGEDINRFRMLPGAIGYAAGHAVYKFDGRLSARRATGSPLAASPSR